jgi:hypothetical protein
MRAKRRLPAELLGIRRVSRMRPEPSERRRQDLGALPAGESNGHDIRRPEPTSCAT